MPRSVKTYNKLVELHDCYLKYMCPICTKIISMTPRSPKQAKNCPHCQKGTILLQIENVKKGLRFVSMFLYDNQRIVDIDPYLIEVEGREIGPGDLIEE